MNRYCSQKRIQPYRGRWGPGLAGMPPPKRVLATKFQPVKTSWVRLCACCACCACCASS